jgi:uncharacterized protein YbgA (DUF1722 family)
MVEFSTRQMAALDALDGYIFKKDSPSCGLYRVKVYAAAGAPVKNGTGLYARTFVSRYPLIPVEEEGRLCDAPLRENFIEKVFCYHRLRLMLMERFSRSRFVEFHTQHKYLLMAHSIPHYRALGQMIAEIKNYPAAHFKEDYSQGFMQALSVLPTRKKHTNVLHHIFGYLKKEIGSSERNDILGTIEDFHLGLIPLIVPVTLLSHYIRACRIDYLLDQIYLTPHPKELMLRNHV